LIAEEHLSNLYDTKQKEQRILYLDEIVPLRKKQNMLLIILSSIFILMLIIGALYLKYHLYTILQYTEEKANETRIIESEKEEQILKNQLYKMEVEKYQKELLAESLLVNHKNKILADLRLFIVETPKLSKHRDELEKIFNDELTKAHEHFNTDLRHIHPALITRLQKRSGNKLTALDLEYCRMIYMKMTSKEMSDILDVEPKTVRMGKYRVKQKLGLDKNEDLNEFIENIGTSC